MNGHIRKRGKNSWQVIFDLPRGPDGKRKQARRTVHGTKREAEAKLRDLLSSAERGVYANPARETVGGFFLHWLDVYAATNVSPRTLRGYKGIVSRYIVPVLGGIQLAALRSDHVQALYADLLKTRSFSPYRPPYTSRP